MPENMGNNILSDAAKDNKVEVVLKREPIDAAQTSGEIDLVEVFKNMGKRKKIFLRLVALCLVIGMAVPLLLFQINKQPDSAAAILTFEEDYNDLVADIKSSFVLQNALNRAGLADTVSFGAVANAITIERVLSEETKQQLEVIRRMDDNAQQKYEKLLAIEFRYTNQYIVTMKNEFAANGSKKSFSLPAGQTRELLDAVMDAFRDYLFDLRADRKLPDNVLASFNVTTTDYLDSLDNIRDALDVIVDYCSAKEKKYDFFRSVKDGLSFADLRDAAETLRDTSIDYIYSYVYTNAFSDNVDEMLTRYKYMIRSLDIKLEEINTNIETGLKNIAEYRNKETAIIMPDADSTQSVISTTDYFNGLVLHQVELYEEKSEIEYEKNVYQDRIKRYEKASTKKSDQAKDEIAAIYEKTAVLYALVSDHAAELFASDYYGYSYFNDIVITVEGTPLSSAAKNVGIGAVVGILIGVCIWGLDGLAMELARSKEKGERK